MCITHEEESHEIFGSGRLHRMLYPENRYRRKKTWSEEFPEGRFRKFGYEEIVARGKTNRDIFLLKDKSLADLDNLPGPDILADKIIENMEASLASFKEIMATINGESEE
ncbi:hypothetical protein [Methanosarcina sp.]|uniref:hypothetical protein n=1 Tax=Methanosarcina sp. TaxID=2213 RepID=UPI003C715A3F